MSRNLEFRYQAVETGARQPTHRVEAVHPEHGVVGKLDWKTRDIRDLRVDPEHRRQGIATQLWHEANRIADGRKIPAPKHSADRTTDGDAWARTVGGKLPRRNRA